MNEKMNAINTALEQMILPEEEDGGLSGELAGVVKKLAAVSEHNAEVIAADLDGKSDVLKALSKKAWDYAREHKKNNGYSMSEKTTMQIAAEYFALPIEAAAQSAAPVPKPEKKILSLEDLL